MPKRTKYIFIDDADLFTIDQINLPDKINNDRSYTDPLSPEDNPKYQTSLERFINRALSVQCTMQDILNLGVLAAKMKKYHSLSLLLCDKNTLAIVFLPCNIFKLMLLHLS